MNSKWKTKSSEVVYQNRWIKIYKEIRFNKKDEKFDFFHASFNQFAKVIAINSQGEIALIENYRYLIGKSHLELPAGGAEEGEDITKSGLRELQEETGIIAKNARLLGEFYTTVGISDQKGYVVLATDLSFGKPILDKFEEIEPVKFYSISKIKELISKNIITDGPTITALTIYFYQNGL
jgi:ADP-ribose pyrophosphatase